MLFVLKMLMNHKRYEDIAIRGHYIMVSKYLSQIY